jgi:hypothetical protein
MFVMILYVSILCVYVCMYICLYIYIFIEILIQHTVLVYIKIIFWFV